MRQANFIAAIVASLVSVGLTSAGEVDSNREHAISQLRAAGVKVERDLLAAIGRAPTERGLFDQLESVLRSEELQLLMPVFGPLSWGNSTYSK